MRRSSLRNLNGLRLARSGGQGAFKGRTWMLVLALNILMAVVMSIVLVWLNIERMDTTYFINIQKSELRDKQGLRAKLEVERDRLLSPYELRMRAEQFGMTEPRPGQIRRLKANP